MMTKTYIGNAALSYNRAGKTNNTVTAITSAVAIQTNCFPLRLEKSKMEDGSVAWIEA